MKTRDEVEDLKRQWEVDPSWDIEDTEGFDEYTHELLLYQLQKQREWDVAAWDRQHRRTQELECSMALVQYIEVLEYRLDQLEQRLIAHTDQE
jgi:hypothetical protein